MQGGAQIAGCQAEVSGGGAQGAGVGPGSQGAGPGAQGGVPACWASASPAGLVHKELDRVLGPARFPRPEDVHALPYTNAVLHEVQRFITLLPHAPRCTVADTQLGPYLLPKVRGRPPAPQTLPPLLSAAVDGAGTASRGHRC